MKKKLMYLGLVLVALTACGQKKQGKPTLLAIKRPTVPRLNNSIKRIAMSWKSRGSTNLYQDLCYAQR